MTARLAVVLLVLAATVPSCQHRHGPATPAREAVRIRVTNNFTLPMEIYVTGSGIMHRLGTVHPNMTGLFVLPEAMVGNGTVELIAYPTADARQQAHSGQLVLGPGSLVDFVIRDPLFGSTATVTP